MNDRRLTHQMVDAALEGAGPVVIRGAKKREDARVARVEARRREDEKVARERAEKREQARREKVNADDEALRQGFLAKFLTLPGSTEAEFAQLWPTIRKAYLTDQLLNGTAKSPTDELKDELRRRNVGIGRADRPE